MYNSKFQVVIAQNKENLKFMAKTVYKYEIEGINRLEPWCQLTEPDDAGPPVLEVLFIRVMLNRNYKHFSIKNII